MSEVPQPRPDGPVDAPPVEATGPAPHVPAGETTAGQVTTAATADPGTTAGGTTDLATAGEDVSGQVDLDEIERDLDAVEAALGRLDDGSYWRDESTGEEIPDSTLDEDPTARRA